MQKYGNAMTVKLRKTFFFILDNLIPLTARERVSHIFDLRHTLLRAQQIDNAEKKYSAPLDSQSTLMIWHLSVLNPVLCIRIMTEYINLFFNHNKSQS